ncbi:prolipoprotein diacylglyceryl transferase [Dyadobacter subterraneus]|uniref:Phosphatidylglycerol--prolipoprotein diacylglyceryl transferase n=1 Tax=Dyadobacter subterraneus TaxID=2773304 RepID=A0ABR9W6E9_9BACT|nr:prolipoprotein diacylglyceryl transferase [Dyadobacter subterraneus]MBE9461040.1 prolipoprotein diacylglyceryl transferase [Dyadobacter subterraneus]
MIDTTISFILWNVRTNVFPSLEIPKWYGLCWTLGIFLSYRIMFYVFKKEGKTIQQLDILTTYVIIGTLLGARLGHILFYDPIYYWNHLIEILPIRLSPSFEFTGLAGLASHGGGIGIFLAIYLYSKKYKESYLWILDRVTIAAALTGAFIRFGNLMNSEMIGIPTKVSWAFIFTKIDQMPRHPAQLYESVFCLFLFFLMFSIWKKTLGKLPEGLLTGIFLVLLFSFRFMDEFLKIDQESFESQMPINMGQILSIPFILTGLLLIKKANTSKLSNF